MTVESTLTQYRRRGVAFRRLRGAPVPVRLVWRSGDICIRFFDADGRHISSALDERVLGIEAHTLNAIPRRIGVAGGA